MCDRAGESAGLLVDIRVGFGFGIGISLLISCNCELDERGENQLDSNTLMCGRDGLLVIVHGDTRDGVVVEQSANVMQKGTF